MNLSEEEIRQGIQDGGIGAITIDTSSFGNPSEMSLEYGLPRKLEQFNNSGVTLLITDIVKSELVKHMEKMAIDAQSALKKALNQVGNGWQISNADRQAVKNLLYQERTPQSCATGRYQSFAERTGLVQIDAHAYVGIDELMQRYFGARPPFSSKKEDKKNEFPDALALISLEKWATENKTQIVVVSRDGDWISFCNESERLIVVDDFAKALSFFHAEASVAANVLTGKLRNGELPNFIRSLKSRIEQYVDNIDFFAEAASSYFFDYETHDYGVTSTSLDDLSSIQLLPIATTDDYIDFEVSVTVIVNVPTTFNFTVKDGIDRDYVPIGSGKYEVSEIIELSLLITIAKEDLEAGEMDDIINDIEVDGPNRVHIDYGEVEPNWMSEPDYE